MTSTKYVVHVKPKTDQVPPGRLADTGLNAVWVESEKQEGGVYFATIDVFCGYLGMPSYRNKLSLISPRQRVKQCLVKGKVPLVCVSAQALERMLWTVTNPEKKDLIDYINANYDVSISLNKPETKKKKKKRPRKERNIVIVRDGSEDSTECPRCEAIESRIAKTLAREHELKQRCVLLEKIVEQQRVELAFHVDSGMHSSEVTMDSDQ